MDPNQQQSMPTVPAPPTPTQDNLPQGHAAGAQPPAVPQIQPPVQEPAPQVTDTIPQDPPAPEKANGKMKLIVIVLIVLAVLGIVIAIIMFLLSSGNSNSTKKIDIEKQSEVGPRDHEAQEFPEFQGVEVADTTVAFNKVDESFRIRYLGKIFHEQDTGEFSPREVFPETADDFTWYGLVDKPEDTLNDGGLFSFKAPDTYQSFMFIMRWDDESGERYQMYRFNDNQVSLLREFTKERLFYVPIIDGYSLGGNFASIKLFTCPTCTEESPEILLYHITTGDTKNIGQVSYFAWGDDDSSYEYKEYKEGVDPETVTLRKNEFFGESIDILDP